MTLRHYARLISFKAWADLRAERERTYLGLLWWVLEPAMFMFVFYFVFGVLRGNRGPDFIAFLLVGVVSWQWIQAGVSHCGDRVLNNLPLVSQVRLSPAVFPLVVLLSDTIKFSVVLILLVVVLWLLGYVPGKWFLVLPILLVVQLILIAGSGLIYSALVPIIPDLRYVAGAVLRAVMFVSGIFFDIDRMDPAHAKLLSLNPVAGLIADARLILLHNQSPQWGRLGLAALSGLLLLAVATLLFRRFGPSYTKLPC
ncbi:MAG: ABC transporter permease [Lysobacteraceae bacterium]